MPIPALGSLRPEDQYFQISLDYTANLCLNQNEIKQKTNKNGHLNPAHCTQSSKESQTHKGWMMAETLRVTLIPPSRVFLNTSLHI